MLGYYDRSDATDAAYLPGLWVKTGDRASIDEHGGLSLRGRSKDIIIRGGENIPVTDVESLIFEHPDVVKVAVIGIPDERLGERICAVVVTPRTHRCRRSPRWPTTYWHRAFRSITCPRK
jgi:cyclohexanecarboxylate-CoA ligase